MWSVVLALSLMNLVQPADQAASPVNPPAASQPAASPAAPPSPVPAPSGSDAQTAPLTPAQSSASPVPPPPQPEAPQVITNYWQHINEVLAMEAARRTKYDLKSKAKFPPPRIYPFDAFQHLKAKDLLRAADEGILEVREKPGGRTEAEVEHQAAVNVNTALEYYPIVAMEEADFTELRYRIQASDPAMQIYLMRRIVPGLANQSLLSEYLQDNARRQREEVKQSLIRVCGDVMANEKVQCVAFEVGYHFLLAEYLEVYRKDPAVVEYQKQNGQPAPAKLAVGPGAITLTPDTLAALEPLGKGFYGYVDALALHLSPNIRRPAEVRLAARQWIETIDTEIYLTDRGKLKALLDQYPEASLKGN